MINLKKRKMIIRFGQHTDQGLIRTENQDAHGKFPEDNHDLSNEKGQLFIVADGMGGHIGGKEASETAVRIVQESYFSNPNSDVGISLKQAFQEANYEIYKQSKIKKFKQKMGTTSTALVLTENRACIAHVGDSRLYRVRANRIEQVTQDHTRVAEMERQGILSEAEAQDHPDRSILYRAMGIDESIEVEIHKEIALYGNEYFILCTDGLSKIKQDEIKQIIESNPPKEACRSLIQLANKRGGEDNSTVQVVKVEKISRKFSKWIKWLIGGVLFILIITIFLLLIKNKSSTEKSEESDMPAVVENAKSITSELDLARTLVLKHELDSALTIYQRVLKSNPMQIGAIEGLNRLAREYLKRADLFYSQNDFLQAVEFYKKATWILPKDERLKDMIARCEQKIQNNRLQQESPVFQHSDSIKSDQSAGIDTVSGINVYNWDFLSLESEDYMIEDRGIIFQQSPNIKMIYSNAEYRDVDIEVITENISSSADGKFGILIGDNEDHSESFFLYGVKDMEKLLLLRVSQDIEEVLLSIPDKSLFSDSMRIKLKLKCLGPYLMIYIDDILLTKWEHEEFISGRVGLYADSILNIRFSEFKIMPFIDHSKLSKE